MTDYTPKVGDRVRVTYEGQVVDTTGLQEEFQFLRFQMEGPKGTFRWVNPSWATVEKLVDPEPVWVNGDVISSKTASKPLARLGGRWLWTHLGQRGYLDEVISRKWANGEIAVLYKADAEKEAV